MNNIDLARWEVAYRQRQREIYIIRRAQAIKRLEEAHFIKSSPEEKKKRIDSIVKNG
jgi:hypothetical protein